MRLPRGFGTTLLQIEMYVCIRIYFMSMICKAQIQMKYTAKENHSTDSAFLVFLIPSFLLSSQASCFLRSSTSNSSCLRFMARSASMIWSRSFSAWRWRILSCLFLRDFLTEILFRGRTKVMIFLEEMAAKPCVSFSKSEVYIITAQV